MTPWKSCACNGSELAVQMARERKAVLEPGAAEDLADLCNADLSAIRNEIEKLATYAGPGQTIRRVDVEALVVSEKKYSVWELADMLATRQRARALAFLDSLLREGEQMPAVVGAMAWMYRKLLEAQELGAARLTWRTGGSGCSACASATAEMAVRQAQKIPRRQLVEGLRALYDRRRAAQLPCSRTIACGDGNFWLQRLIGGREPAGKQGFFASAAAGYGFADAGRALQASERRDL